MVSDLTVIKHNHPKSKYPTHDSGITQPLGSFRQHATRTLTKNTPGLFYPFIRIPIIYSTSSEMF